MGFDRRNGSCLLGEMVVLRDLDRRNGGFMGFDRIFFWFYGI